MGTLSRGGLQCPYLVGDIYITTRSENPSSLWQGTTWEKVGSGRALMGADSSHGVGTTVDSGLPNISGTFRVDPDQGWCRITTSGCFTADTNGTRATGGSSGSSTVTTRAVFNASNSSTVYGASSIVQPPAFFCYFWKRLS